MEDGRRRAARLRSFILHPPFSTRSLANMHVPVLKQNEYMIASVQSVLSDADLLLLRDDLAERVGRFRSRGVIVDVTVLDVIDSFATRMLSAIAHMLKLRGAETVIVG